MLLDFVIDFFRCRCRFFVKPLDVLGELSDNRKECGDDEIVVNFERGVPNFVFLSAEPVPARHNHPPIVG